MRSLLVLLLTFPLLAQHAPYASMQQREIKALSDEQVQGYRDGAGMGLALPAELNGYPGPKHVLELAEQLELKDGQREAVRAIFERMKKRAIDLGGRIIDAEAALDRSFRNGSIDPASLEAQTGTIATLHGQLRAAHLAAHLETKVLLTPAQLAAYSRLRGYGPAEGRPHHH